MENYMNKYNKIYIYKIKTQSIIKCIFVFFIDLQVNKQYTIFN